MGMRGVELESREVEVGMSLAVEGMSGDEVGIRGVGPRSLDAEGIREVEVARRGQVLRLGELWLVVTCAQSST